MRDGIHISGQCQLVSEIANRDFCHEMHGMRQLNPAEARPSERVSFMRFLHVRAG
jgi:hypothetical protein